MTDFNLRRLVGHVLTTTSLSDPREVASKVGEMIGREHREAAIEQMLPHYVLTVMSQGRMLGRQPVPGASPSSKVTRVREDWQKRLAIPLSVDGVWKRFGECTAADLRMVSASLRAAAAQTLAKADYYEQVAAALPAGAVVASLPGDPTEAAAA